MKTSSPYSFNLHSFGSRLSKFGVKKFSYFRQDSITRPGIGNPIKSSRGATVYPSNEFVANESTGLSGSNDSKHSRGVIKEVKKLSSHGIDSRKPASIGSDSRKPSLVGNDSRKPASVGNDSKPLVCDKCDGKHETSDCPHYPKDREKHPDAQKNAQKLGGTSKLPGAIIRSGRVVRQPGDGSCLFHSLSYGLRDGSNASSLRREICNFINKYPNMRIADTPLSDWIKWDSGGSVGSYTRRMSGGAWGGGIEMASVSMMKDVNVHAYERSSSGFTRISAFDHPNSPETKRTVRVLYCGGVHYDALVAS